MALPESDLQFTVSVKSSLDSNSPDLRRVRRASTDLTSGHSGAFLVVKKTAADAMHVLEQQIRKEIEEVLTKSEDGMMKAMEFIRDEAKELTPIDTTALVNSAFAATERGKVTVKGRVGYNITSGNMTGGATMNAPYAAFVHEVNQNHDPTQGASKNSNPKGQWKFLQTALEQNQKEIQDIIAKKVK